MPLFHIGIDDTDSLRMGCTTYVGAVLVGKLLKKCRFVDYPNLIRLNPNVPWKSRGNAAVCLRLLSDMPKTELLNSVVEVVEQNRDQEDEKNQPGIAILEGQVPEPIKMFAQRSLYDVLTLEEAVGLAKKFSLEYRLIRGGRGLIGGIGAIGNTLEGDHTFELIVYRKKSLRGRKREVGFKSVESFDKATAPFTFNNIDYEKRRMLITPHGPDPILFGVRGETAAVVLKALKALKFSGQEIWTVFRSNQGTDAHLARKKSVSSLRPYEAAVLEGIVGATPHAIKGGHVIASLRDETGEIDIAGYEPSGNFKKIVRSLIPGDHVRASGGVRLLDGGKLTFNLERLEILKQTEEIRVNPTCPNCGKRMKSEGRGKGYQCRICGLKTQKDTMKRISRDFPVGSYLPPPRAMRHLTKPANRYGLEKKSWDCVVGSFYGVF